MKNAALKNYIPEKPGASDAWQMWLKLNKLADFLWETFENDFVEFCLMENHNNKTVRNNEGDYPF